MSGMEANTSAQQIVGEFTKTLGQVEPTWSIKERPDGPYLLFHFAAPNDRLFGRLEEAISRVDASNPLLDRSSIVERAKKPSNVVSMPEAQMLQKDLSESLTVDRNTFGDDFWSRYTPSVTNYEQSIVGNANFIVYGRRGSGKSSLLAYAMHSMTDREAPFAWVALQTYSGRDDENAIASVLAEIYFELAPKAKTSKEFESLAAEFEGIAEGAKKTAFQKILRIVPRARKILSQAATRSKPLTIFLDDIHVIGESLQPKLLSVIYSLTRGNNSYIKTSGIEQFTNIWDSSTRQGLEPPHDAQILKLDHNLTMPDRSEQHIISILDAHARFCGLPGIRYLAEDAVLSRLVLIAAAVPRDALSLFSQAITKALIKGQKAVTITAVNAAASEAVEEKLKDVGRDALTTDTDVVREMLDRIKDFCVKQHGINAFLVRIDSRSVEYNLVQRLIALRFVHVLHEGITPHKVAERYVALMLDFGFYIGIRAAKSVTLYPDTPKLLPVKELRKLPIFSLRS